MTETLDPIPPVREPEGARSRRRLSKWAKWSLASLLVYVCVILTVLRIFVWQPHAEEKRAKTELQAYLKAHGVIARVVAVLHGPNPTDLGTDGAGDVFALAGANGGHLWRLAPSGRLTSHLLTSPEQPPPFFRMAVSADGSVYTVALSTDTNPHGSIVRVTPSGKTDLTWASRPTWVWSLAASGNSLLGLQRRTPDDKSFRVVDIQGGSATTTLTQHAGDPTAITASSRGDIFITRGGPTGERSDNTIDHVLPDGRYVSDWATIPSTLPKGTPPILEKLHGLLPAPIVFMAAAPDNSLYVSDASIVWHFGASGALLGAWWLSDPSGTDASIFNLTVAPDGTVYSLGFTGSKEGLPGDAAITKLTFPKTSS